MDALIPGINLFVICIALALFEVQIEGPHGWATKLPTWRFDRPWLRKLTNGKPITGYHVYLNIVILAFIHYPLIWSEWSWSAELYIISQYFIIAVWWDFLWFVLNPAFGVRRFKTENIWWHDKWILGIPKDYYTGTAVSVSLWLIADLIAPGPGFTLGTWATLLGVVVGGTVLTAIGVGLFRRTEEVVEQQVTEKLLADETEEKP